MMHSIDRVSFFLGFFSGAGGGITVVTLVYWLAVRRVKKKLSAIFGAAGNKLGGVS
jgi:hypothetical protein